MVVDGESAPLVYWGLEAESASKKPKGGPATNEVRPSY